MTRTARFTATAGLSLLLLSGVLRKLALWLGYGRLPGALPSVLWLVPVAALVLLVRRSRTARSAFARIRASRTRLATATVALAAFTLTLVPGMSGDRWMSAYLAMASTVLILLLGIGYPLLMRFTRVPRRLAGLLLEQLKPAHFLFLTSGAVLVVANLISWQVFQHIPHVQDTIVQVFQARVFASGHITLPARFDDYFFSYIYLVNDGARLFAEYPFGHSLLLALGSLVRAEWIVNPLLGATEIIVLYFLGKEAYDERTGRIAALLGTVSPFLLFMSAEYVNHASSLLFLSLFLLFFLRTIRPMRGSRAKSSLADPILSGLSLAVALNVRPLSALATCIPVAGCGIYLLLKSHTRALPAFFAMLVPVLLGLGAFGLYNYLTTGDPLLPGYKAYGMLEYNHAQWGLGFGARGFEAWGRHTPLRGLIQTGRNLNALNLYLFESPFPGLLLVLLLFLVPARKAVDWLLLATFAAVPALYFFYWFQDLWFGPRFLYDGLAPVLLLGARGLVEFPRFVAETPGTEAGTRTRDTMATAAVLSLAVALTVGLPRLLLRYSYSYGEYLRVRAKVTEDRVNGAVIFLGPPRAFYYGAAFLDNALDFQGSVVYAVDRGAENYLLMRRFPGRTYYRADPDTFFQISDPESLRNTPEMRDLDQAGRFISQIGMSGYRYVLLPYREAGTLIDTGTARCWTFREASYGLLRRQRESSDFLPAIAVFMPDDPRRYSPLFEPMREQESYDAGGCRFTFLFSADSGKAVVFDIHPGTNESGDTCP